MARETPAGSNIIQYEMFLLHILIKNNDFHMYYPIQFKMITHILKTEKNNDRPTLT